MTSMASRARRWVHCSAFRLSLHHETTLSCAFSFEIRTSLASVLACRRGSFEVIIPINSAFSVSLPVSKAWGMLSALGMGMMTKSCWERENRRCILLTRWPVHAASRTVVLRKIKDKTSIEKHRGRRKTWSMSLVPRIRIVRYWSLSACTRWLSELLLIILYLQLTMPPKI
jgi:hypothetical protein